MPAFERPPSTRGPGADPDTIGRALEEMERICQTVTMPWIGAIDSPSDDGRFLFHPFRLGEAGIEPGGAPIRLHGPTKRRKPLVALQGRWLWAATRDRRTSKPVVAQLDLAGDSGKPAAVAPLPAKPEKFPASLAVHEQTCFVGWNAEVHAILFEGDSPRSVVLRGDGCPTWKPFDIICACPPFVFAVDDIVTPKWRMCIDISDSRSPNVVWTHYFEQDQAYAEYFGATACGSRVVLWSAYGNTYGSGCVLELVAVTARGIRHVADLSLHMGPRARDGDRMAVFEERRFSEDAITGATGEPLWGDGDPLAELHRPTQSTTMLDEMAFSRWNGIAAVRDQVFVAAGSQGLLRFGVEDRGFCMLPRATLGECLDVVPCGADVAVLVRSESGRRVLQFRPDASGGLVAISGTDVDERVCHLVGQSA